MNIYVYIFIYVKEDFKKPKIKNWK